VGDRGFRGRTMYLSTVDFARWVSNLRSSPTRRGERQAGFALDIFRIRSRIFLDAEGRPGFPLRLNRNQCARNLLRCQAITVLA